MNDENDEKLIPMNSIPSKPPDKGKINSPIRRAAPLELYGFPNPPTPNSNRLPATIPNLDHMLNQYGIIARYNLIKKKIEINIPGLSGSTDNLDNVTLTHIISLAELNGIRTGQIPAYVEAIADKNTYNPVTEWIRSKAWDGVDRLPAIYETVTEREGFPEGLKEILMRKWLLSAVAAALSPNGFKSRGVLTFQGEQSIGKTSWVKSLVTDPVLKETAIKIDHHLDGANKDSIIGAVTHWIVEIGELDSSFTKDIARLKGVLTSDSDKVRRPYARTDSEYQRRTVFFASVNQADFLVDRTGNSRFWTIPASKINYTHGIDMQQVFAQLAKAFSEGEQWWLTKEEEEILASANSEHLSSSAIREGILELIDLERKDDPSNPAMTARDVLLKMGYERPTNSQCKECAAVLRDLFGTHKRIKGSNKWRIPIKSEGGTYCLPPLRTNEDLPLAGAPGSVCDFLPSPPLPPPEEEAKS